MKNTSYPVAQEPADIPRLFVEHWNNYDAEGIARLFTEDAEFVNVVGLWWHDRQSIFKAHDYGLKKIFHRSTLELRQVKVKTLSETVAVLHARMKLTGQTAHSSIDNPGNRQNIFTFVAQRFPEGWLCAAAHNTDIVPGAETNITDEPGRMKSVDYRK